MSSKEVMVSVSIPNCLEKKSTHKIVYICFPFKKRIGKALCSRWGCEVWESEEVGGCHGAYSCLWLLGRLPLCSVVHSSASHLDVFCWWTHFQAPQNLPFPPFLLFPVAFWIIPLRDLLLQIVYIESVPQNQSWDPRQQWGWGLGRAHFLKRLVFSVCIT